MSEGGQESGQISVKDQPYRRTGFAAGGDLEPVSSMKIRMVLAVASSALLAACGTSSQTGGHGGLLGQSASSGKVATTIITAMNGGLVGGTVGTGLSEKEKRSALEAEYKALEYTASGQKVGWQGDSGHSGEVVAAQPYRVGSQDCRQYTQTVNIGGASSTARGTACRNADGSWTPLT
jgi:surface antigen